jgi:ATP-dependent RNA helicase SUPV3L1/SUV3
MDSNEASAKAERAKLKKTVAQLGWKLSGRDTAEVRIERELTFGPRTVLVRGRVPVPLPAELTAAAGERAASAVAEPTLEAFRTVMERTADSILSEPDDVQRRHVFESASFFSALEYARRGLVREYQDLENRRIDQRVEADLGLRFYVEGFTHQRRSFEYFVGPTNSGKTHAATEALRSAASGTYLAPLRLLALEVHERLNESGLPASLVTGEERVLVPGANHVSSTVEMVDLSRSFEVAVVDEAQMLADPQRGWAWTLAIAGVRAERVILCGSEDGLHAAERLAKRLGETITVRRFERKNPLRVVDAVPLASLRRGDAVVAFSRNEVVELQGLIGRSGLTTAAIYGSLSPLVRRREAERFRSGEAAVLVATDAIGLGLNLPIRRLIFATLEKYDGEKTRLLRPPEIRQIAGRAGRYGIHEEGQVTAVDAKWTRLLRDSIERFDPPEADMPIWISPTDEHLRRLSAIIGTTLISRLLQFFQTRVLREEDSDVRISDLSDSIEVAVALESSERFVTLPLSARATYSRAPVNTRGNALAILTRWGEQHAETGSVPGFELTSGLLARDRLLLYEDRSRLATLYLWLAQRFPGVYTSVEEAARVRDQTDEEIHDALLQHGTRRKPVRPERKPFRRKGPPPFNPRRIKR